ncbi:MAG: GNAT family N-acetyltransferase [Anaerolineae bacterium]|nr:GNAT family N-acetyltransferase [Anaerolineae bacterium]
MPAIHLRPAEPDRDFAQLAVFFTILEDWPNTAQSLKAYYERERERITQVVAVDETHDVLGFYWATRDGIVPERVTFDLYVRPERRGEGVGRELYDAMLEALAPAQIKVLHVSVWDNCPQGRAFADRRGFAELRHRIAMALDLRTFDDGPYDEILARLGREGFRFTSMGELGDTEEAQRNLYRLNDATGRDIPGTAGEPSWTSFEDFRQSVCAADWYKPDGQMVVIDTATGAWVAMSAITRPEGAAFAYNLHTGVDRAYRGRKLAQAVKVRALRYARDVLGIDEVRTHHTVQNLPMIAIDRKLGYVRRPGTYLMTKTLA